MNGFTFVELLVALIVASIIFTAVAALAYALGAANDAAGDKSEKQAQVRFATLRISELIRHCKLIDTADNGIVVWKADSDGDNEIDLNEQVYIEAGEGRDHIQLREPDGNPVVLIPQCSNVQFRFDEPLLPPMKRKFVSISFDLVENGVSHQYEINAALRGWAGNLLNDAGDAIVSDDD
ncbi:MAG: prepilin-type N-terminal cleavage/methylation domain-containing protein [Phycisphaerae bacterium]